MILSCIILLYDFSWSKNHQNAQYATTLWELSCWSCWDQKTREETLTHLEKNIDILSEYYYGDWADDREAIFESENGHKHIIAILGEDHIWNLLTDYYEEGKEWLKVAKNIITK